MLIINKGVAGNVSPCPLFKPLVANFSFPGGHIQHIFTITSQLWTFNVFVIAVTYDYCSLLKVDSSFIWCIQK